MRMSLTTNPKLIFEDPDPRRPPPRIRTVGHIEIGLRDYLTPEMKCEMVDMQLKIDACDTILHALKYGPWEKLKPSKGS